MEKSFISPSLPPFLTPSFTPSLSLSPSLPPLPSYLSLLSLTGEDRRKIKSYWDYSLVLYFFLSLFSFFFFSLTVISILLVIYVIFIIELLFVICLYSLLPFSPFSLPILLLCLPLSYCLHLYLLPSFPSCINTFLLCINFPSSSFSISLFILLYLLPLLV